MGTGILKSQTNLKESDIGASDSRAMDMESQAPSVAEHDAKARPPDIKELESLSQQPMPSKVIIPIQDHRKSCECFLCYRFTENITSICREMPKNLLV